MNRLKLAGLFLLNVTLVVFLIFSLVWLFMFLWNDVVTYVFALPDINMWQSFALLLLTRLLFFHSLPDSFKKGDKE